MAVEFFGYTDRKELSNVVIPDLYENQEYRTKYLQFIDEHGSAEDYPINLKKKDGTVINAIVNSAAVRDETGQPVYYLGTIRDLAERTRADEAYRILVDRSLQGLAIFQERRIVFVNHAFAKIVGYTEDELLQMPKEKVWASVHQDDREKVWSRHADRLMGINQPSHYEFRLIRKDGKTAWLEVYASRINYHGKPAAQMAAVDVTERKLAESAFYETNRRLLGIMNHSPALIAIFDGMGRLLMASRSTLKLIGRDEREIIGKPFAQLFLPNQADAIGQRIQSLIENKKPIVAEERFHDGNHEQVYTSIMFPLSDAEGDYPVFCSISSNITERKMAEEELLRAKDAAEAATKAKSEFLASMSHEIRTPMNAVIGMTGILMDENLSSEQKECVQTIRSSGEALLDIINNILDLSKIEGGMMELECQPFGLRSCIEDAMELVAADASMKGLKLGYAIQDQTKTSIWGDPTRLRQILVNLLGNAVKFTKEGDVGLYVSSKMDEHGNQKIHFAVRDTGIGIPPDKMDRLFQPFSQVDASTTRRYGGTGLGLAISKMLVGMMDGRIWAESCLGKGSTFHFTIQTRLFHGELSEIIVPDKIDFVDRSMGLNRGMSILLAEDNLVNQKVTQKMLQKLGFRADVAANGLEVLQAMERQPYDVILMDILMPEMNGLEATKAIRQRWHDGPKIIAMTASALKGDREKCLAAGADVYLSKPTKIEELICALAGCSRPGRKEKP